VADSERNLRQAQRELADTQAQLAALNAQLAQLRTLFASKTSEAAELRARAELMERRLAAASRLIVGLGSERERWAADMQGLVGRNRITQIVCRVRYGSSPETDL